MYWEIKAVKGEYRMLGNSGLLCHGKERACWVSPGLGSGRRLCCERSRGLEGPKGSEGVMDVGALIRRGELEGTAQLGLR